ncbi:MAG: tetratricopeptide repeat protein [Chitinophagaceae bacterium]
MYKGLLIYSIYLILSIQFAQAQRNANLSSDEYYRLARIEGNQKGNFNKAAQYCKLGLEKSPYNLDIRQYLGKCYLELKKFDSARFELKKVADQNPNNTESRHYLVNVETQTGRYSSAICYVNELLQAQPYSKTLWLKKIALYNEMGNKIEAGRSLTRLYQIFPEDTMVKRYYKNVMEEQADRMYKKGDYKATKELYSQVLSLEPTDMQTLQKQINNELKAGKKTEALELIENGLTYYPYDPKLIIKKIGLLQDAHKYPEAISYTEQLLKKYPSATLRNVLKDLKLESARFYNNTDPYVLYQKIYEENPGNEEAFNYLLNNALSKGYYDEAMMYLKTALKRNPNNKIYLLKQLSLYETQNRTLEANRLLEKLATKFPSDPDLRDKYATLLYTQAKEYAQDQQYEQALPAFEKLTRYSDYTSVANDYIYSIYLSQKDYPKALNQIDKLIARNPRKDEYKFKKSGLLEEMGRFEEALEITNSLALKNPNNIKYKNAYLSQSIPYVKTFLENEKYDSAMVAIDNMIEADPSNEQAYLYGINALSNKKDYDAAIDMCDKALNIFPDSKNFSLKKAGLYQEKKDYNSAINELELLRTNFPYNENIKGSLAENYLIKGKQYEKEDNIDSAFTYYVKALELNPEDTFALYRTINIELNNNALEIAKYYTDKGLAMYPDNKLLLTKKGIIYEKENQYDSAYHYLKLAEPPYGYNEHFKNYLDYLYAKKFKNQIGITFTRAFFDSTQFRSAISTIEYTRFGIKNTYTARFYYAARPIGTGVQNELEWFHKFDKKLYSQFNFAFANPIAFPKFRVSASLFRTLDKELEIEGGVRYVLQKDNASFLSLIVGAAKSWEDVWLNIRFFGMTDFGRVYQAITLQSRYYLNYRNDYFTIMGSLGTPPEEKTIDYQLNSFLNYTTRMVGAGYQHKLKHRTTLGIQGNWFSFKFGDQYNVNQYNLFVTLLTMF